MVIKMWEKGGKKVKNSTGRKWDAAGKKKK